MAARVMLDEGGVSRGAEMSRTGVAAHLTLISLLAAACRPDPQPPQPEPAPPASAEGPLVEAPDRFVRDVRASEQMAGKVGKVAKALCAALRTGDPDGGARQFTADLRARAVRLEGQRRATRNEPITQETLPADPTVLDRAGLSARLLELTRSRFAAVRACAIKPYRFRLASDHHHAYTAMLAHIDGQSPDGRRLTVRGTIRAHAVKEADDEWRFRRLETGPLEVVATGGRLFRDVSRQVGFGLGRSQKTEESVRARTNDRDLETIGGLAVIDFDGDGRDDLCAWNRRRTFQLFLNDGRGGFTKRVNPIPPAATGLFHLWVDLDGDGADELVSSEVVACKDGRARLGLFRRRGDTLKAVPGGLSFAHDCGGFEMLKYQHLAVADVDRDGHLDLFASGFSNRRSKGDRHNLFNSDDGEPNLLFMGRGGLRFSEEARARGIDGHTFSYAATFFDADGDGDDDLYVVNDYGPNELFTNDGAGRFARTPEGPLTANGQSMGVTVGDFDGDLDLDVYVSNMFSKAGHRIVPLVEGQIRPETYRALEGLARGNSLFARDAEGRFTDTAGELGVAKAGWAWGQAFFDADNDGDRDLYVTNGMTSHADARAPDY